jgi:hypothetical protein
MNFEQKLEYLADLRLTVIFNMPEASQGQYRYTCNIFLPSSRVRCNGQSMAEAFNAAFGEVTDGLFSENDFEKQWEHDRQAVAAMQRLNC